MSRPKNVAPKKDRQALQRRMAGKKGQVVQLQTEVNNEEDWEKLLTKEGLIVVDVYSEWCGPCVGMVGNLKKVKVDIGGESLHLAIAKSDEIEVLKRFRNKSEPTWMFIGGGQLVNVTFGANAPKVCKLIEAELRQEQRVLRGETWRRAIPFDELSEEERERMEAAERIRLELERETEEKTAQEKEEKRMRTYLQMSENLLHETIVVCFPHTIEPDIGCVMLTELEALFRSKSVFVSAQNKINITPEMCEEVFYRGSMVITDDFLDDIASGPSLALWIKFQGTPVQGTDGAKGLGEIEKLICQEINMVELEDEQELVEPNPKSLAAKYNWVKPGKREEEGAEEEAGEITGIETTVPGCWTPATYLTKCAACKYFMPSRAEKVIPPEEPPPPPRMVIIFDVSKQKECFEMAAEYQNEVLEIGFFNCGDPDVAQQLCKTPEQYARLPQMEANKVVIVLNKTKSDTLLSFAGLGAVYISPDEATGEIEADKFFPPGVERDFSRLNEPIMPEEPEEEPIEVEQAPEEEEESEQTEDDLMASLGLPPGGI